MNENVVDAKNIYMRNKNSKNSIMINSRGGCHMNGNVGLSRLQMFHFMHHGPIEKKKIFLLFKH